MGPCCCSKRHVTFVWATLECLFFTGVIFGWVWLTVTLRRDAYFLDLCNVSLSEDISRDLTKNEVLKDSLRKDRPKCRTTTTTVAPGEVEYRLPFNGTQYFCDEQEDRLDLMYVVIIIVRNFLILPVGIFLDKYGTTRTRLLTVYVYLLIFIWCFFNIQIRFVDSRYYKDFFKNRIKVNFFQVYYVQQFDENTQYLLITIKCLLIFLPLQTYNQMFLL